MPGIAEEMRRLGLAQTPLSPLSRGVCGTLGTSLIVNLPGKPAGAVFSLRSVLPLLAHALRLLAGDNPHEAAAPGAVVQTHDGAPVE